LAYEIEFQTGDIQRAAARLGRVGRRALPGAIQEALTVLAYRARKAERGNLQDRLDRPKRFTLQSIAAQTARRTNDGWESRVYALPAMNATLTRLELGGNEQRGLGIADPSISDRYGSLGRTGRQRLLRRRDTFEGTIKGYSGIWAREAGRRGVRLLVAYVTDPQWDPMLGFEEVALDVAATFAQEAQRQLAKRMRQEGYS